MNELDKLEPKEVFRFFREIAAIPRGSRNTKQVSDYLADFARQRGLEYYQDELNNVIIRKPASAGYEDAEPVVIQGHMDMVCEKTPDCPIDMEHEGLSLAVDGDWLYAEGTTLGGDDGIAVAMGLAALDSGSIEHPPLELLCTVDEEIGMEGAQGLDVSHLKGRRLINIDSEDEGILTVSCAGGVSACVMLPAATGMTEGVQCEITVDGLAGGHSGSEIDKEHASANILMGRLLEWIRREADYALVSIAGGTKDNAICKRCQASIIADPADIPAIQRAAASLEDILKRELKTPDPGVRITVIPGESCSASALTKPSLDRVITWLRLTPTGIQHMSMDIPGLVETSLNLGALQVSGDGMKAVYAVRSSVSTRREELCSRLECLAEHLGGSVKYSGVYPAWEYRSSSPLRDAALEAYREQYSAEMSVEAIHAGLECGLFAGKMGPDFDAVSFGPTMTGVHTSDEKLSISSTARVWEYLQRLLAKCR